jgi:hypothetical protein
MKRKACLTHEPNRKVYRSLDAIKGLMDQNL